jgi:hypothetical protein
MQGRMLDGCRWAGHRVGCRGADDRAGEDQSRRAFKPAGGGAWPRINDTRSDTVGGKGTGSDAEGPVTVPEETGAAPCDVAPCGAAPCGVSPDDTAP